MYTDLLLNYVANGAEGGSVFTSPQNKSVFAAALYFRKLLAVDVNPPIFIIFELPLFVPALLRYLFCPCSNALQLEVAWILTNIACGSSKEVAYLLSCSIDLPTVDPPGSIEVVPPRRGNLVNILHYLLRRQVVCPFGSINAIEALRDHLLWLLGNLTADSITTRIVVLNNSISAGSTAVEVTNPVGGDSAIAIPADPFPPGGIVQVLLQMVGIEGNTLRVDSKLIASLSTMRTLVWIFNNLSRDLMVDPGGELRRSLLTPDQVLGVCSMLSLLTTSPDDELLLDW